MARTKGGYVTRRWHKKVLKLTKGQWGTRGRLFRRSNEAMLKSLFYAYRDRRARRGDLRRLWIIRINAAAHLQRAELQPLHVRLEERRASNWIARCWQTSPCAMP